MKPTYYYPNKLSLKQKESPSEIDDWYDSKWAVKARKLRERRWERIEAIERAQRQMRSEHRQQLRQRKWLRSHGWPRIAQPVV
jgi:hypothetical protein